MTDTVAHEALDDVINRALEAARAKCGLDVAYVSQFEDGAHYVRHATTRPSRIPLVLDTATPLETTYCQRVVDGRLDPVVPDTAANPVTAELAVTKSANLGAYVGAPIRLPDGRLYGTFCCASADAHPELTARDGELLALLATLVGEHLGREQDRLADERAQHELLASVSHDLRTPLKAISFLAEDAAAGTVDFTDAARQIRQQSSQVLDLVDALMVVATHRTSGLVLQRDHVDVGLLVCQVVETCATAAGPNGDRVDCTILEDGIEADVDATRLTQVVQNLVDNALKYSPDGGPVGVSVRRDATTVCIEVTDAGIGISPADLPHVRERFFRAASARQLELPGAGVGLATVQAIVDSHEGTLDVTSELGRGSTFAVRLPLTRD